MADIKAPVFPESVADGTIVEWHVSEGEQVNRDDVLAEIETDKVVLEVVAPDDGVLTKIVKGVDETVQSAELIAQFEAKLKTTKQKIPKLTNQKPTKILLPKMMATHPQTSMLKVAQRCVRPPVRQVLTLLTYKAVVVAVVLPKKT